VKFEKYDDFDGGDIDVIYLQYIYMTMIRTQAQIFHQQRNFVLRMDRARFWTNSVRSLGPVLPDFPCLLCL